MTQVPRRDPLGGGGGHGQGHQALEGGAVPEEVVAGPQGVGPGLLGGPGRPRPGGRAGRAAGCRFGGGPDGPAHGGTVSCTKVGRISPIGPGPVADRSKGTVHRNLHRSDKRSSGSSGPRSERPCGRRCTGGAADAADWEPDEDGQRHRVAGRPQGAEERTSCGFRAGTDRR